MALTAGLRPSGRGRFWSWLARVSQLADLRVVGSWAVGVLSCLGCRVSPSVGESAKFYLTVCWCSGPAVGLRAEVLEAGGY